MTKKQEKLLASTIFVEYTSASIIRCTARVAFTFAGLHIEAGAQYFLAQSSEDPSRYYVVAWYDRGAEWTCSCGASHKFTDHHKAVKKWVLDHVVKPREKEILSRPAARVAVAAQPAQPAQPASTIDQDLDAILAEIDEAKQVRSSAQPVQPDIAERGSFHSARAFSMSR